MSLRWSWVVVAVAVTVGCGDGKIGGGQDASAPDVSPPDAGGTDAPTDAGSGLSDGGVLADGGPALPRGTGTITLAVDDRVREAELLVPTSWAPGAPCMVALHGNGSSADELLSWTGLNALARDRGFAVAALRAIPGHADGFDWDRETSLSAGNIDGAAALATKSWLVSRGCDSGRVYLMGHRFGGMLAFRIAMEASNEFAAVHMSSATRPTGMGLVSAAERAIPVHLLIGEDDDLFTEATATRDELLADPDYDDSRVQLETVPGLTCCHPRPLEGRMADVYTWLSMWTL